MTKNDWQFYARIIALVLFTTLSIFGIAWFAGIGFWAYMAITAVATVVPALISLALSKWTKLSPKTISWTELGTTQALFTAGMVAVSTSWTTFGLSLLLIPVLTIASFIAPGEVPTESGEVDLSHEVTGLMSRIMDQMPKREATLAA